MSHEKEIGLPSKERSIEESLACSAETADILIIEEDNIAVQLGKVIHSPEEKARMELQKTHKFTYTPKGILLSKVRTYFMLGTDTSYDDQRGYPDGEIFSAFFNMLKEAIIVDGPKQESAFCVNANEVPSHTVGLILSDLSQSQIEILNLGGHSRGAVGSLIIAHELDRIKNAINSSMNPKEIREAVLNSTDPDTKKILKSETAHFNDEQWQELAKNITNLKLNLFLLDPVPGNYRLSSGYRWQDPRICKADHFEVPNIVENIHVQYAGDERTHQFDTIRVKHVNPEFKRLTLDLLPGHHGTVSGNITDRGTLDKSSFVSFYAKLKDLLLNKKEDSPTAAAALKPDAIALQSPSIKSHIDQCITEVIEVDWSDLEGKKENLKKLIWDLIDQHFDKSFVDLIKEIAPRTELSAKAFTSEIYLSIRRAYNSAQKITSINMLEYFIKHGSLSENDFVGTPIQEEIFGNQYQTFKEFIPLIFRQKSADSGVLTDLDIEKLKIYDLLSILKKTFISFRSSYYDGLSPFSSDHIVLGRQVRCGLTWGSLQDYVSIFHDDSPYVNSDHADLIYKHAFNELGRCQESQDGPLTPKIHKITLLLHKIILVSNNAKQRHAVLEPKTFRDYIPLLSSSKAILKVKIDNSKLNHFKELLSSCLTDILFTNDKDSIEQLFEIVNQIDLLNDVRKVLFKDVPKREDKDEDLDEDKKRAVLLHRITKDSEGKVIEPEEAFKDALKKSIIDATSQALKNLEEQVKLDTAVILGLWKQLKEVTVLTNEEKETYYSTIEQNIHKVLQALIFIKDNNLNCSQGFLGELQQPKNELLDILKEILIKKQQLISSLTEEIHQKEKEVDDIVKRKDSEVSKHARSFEKKEKELEETRKTLSKKEADLKVLKIEYKDLSEKQDKATADLHATQAILEATAAKLVATEEELNEIKDKIESANAQLKQAHDTHESLLIERDEFRTELYAILEENKILKAENADLKEQIKALQITIDVQAFESEKQLEAKIAEKALEQESLQTEQHRLSTELTAVVAREEALKAENTRLQAQTTELQRIIDTPADPAPVDQSEQIRQLESQIAERQSQIDGWQDENARNSLKALKKLIKQYDTHLNNHYSDQGVLKREVMNDLRAILEQNITPRNKVDQCRTVLGKEETKATLSKHRDSKFIRFIHDCLRILTGVAFYQKINGHTFFNRPSHGERFVQQSAEILAPSA